MCDMSFWLTDNLSPYLSRNRAEQTGAKGGLGNSMQVSYTAHEASNTALYAYNRSYEACNVTMYAYNGSC
jgi:hypothetical protein